jgi:poly(A) polymerase
MRDGRIRVERARMIRALIRRVFKKGGTKRPAELKSSVLAQAAHGIARDHVSSCALRVCNQLSEAGFRAFVVGGAVRDLLLKREPKDFDVATDATPEQVRKVIRRSRIIGRRFQIVHAMCGDETVEVSTFRAVHGAVDEGEGNVDEHGRVLRDNVFGSQAEDASRRDFTVNALFYDPVREEVWDYFHGVADLRAKKLRMIGDPVARYREDPVRMLRAVRFAAKLGFSMDEAVRKPIREMGPLLANVPKARLLEEMMKLLLSGHAWDCVTELRKDGLHHGLLPLIDVILEQPLGERFVKLALDRTDERINADKSVSPGFLFAALLWHEVLAAWQKLRNDGVKSVPALFQAMEQVTDAQREILAIPRRFDAIMKEIWTLQPRFEQRFGGRPFKLLENTRFRAGYDFLLLRCESGEIAGELGDWWSAFVLASHEERQAMLMEAPPQEGRRRRRGRRSKNGVKAEPANTVQ